jgi:DNA-binding HxlR family transcriptional regulator
VPTSRSYGDACGIARALDAVGERWGLLVVRELLLGPQRFSDIRRGLPGASSNLVADRLRELDGRGVVRRRRLPPPAGSWVYELTEWGRELEPVVLALGAWGLRVPFPPEPVTLGATSVLIYLRGVVRPDPGAPDTTYRIELDSRVWTVRTTGGLLDVEPGEPPAADAGLCTTPAALNALLERPSTLDAAIAGGTVTVEGDRRALRRLFAAVAPAAVAPAATPVAR